MKPTWTIAIPTYQGERYLAETLRSVMAQSDQDFELIVCDDVSTDGSLEIVEKNCGSRARIFRNESGKSLGLARNWNRCVEMAQGEWITILHQDDLIESGFVATQRGIAGEFPQAGLIASTVQMIDKDGNAIAGEVSGLAGALADRGEETFLLQPGELSRFLVSGNPIRCPGASFRRQLHQSLGGFRADLKYVVDWSFWFQLGKVAPVVVTSKVLASQRWHEGSETQRLAANAIDLEENLQVMLEILQDESISSRDRPRFREFIRNRMARAWWTRAYQAACGGNRKMQMHALGRVWEQSPVLFIKSVVSQPRTVARLLLGKK